MATSTLLTVNDLKSAEPVNWRKKVSGTHVSASAGNYRIHRSGDKSITAYQFEPFIPLGSHDSVPLAMEACRKHWEKTHDA